MDFEIVTLPPCLVAGLTVPLAGREVSARDLDLVNFTWDRYLARGRETNRVAAYVGQDDHAVAVLGYQIDELAELAVGDVIAKVPAGQYAKFTVTDKPYDLLRTAWAQVRRAQTAGEIQRSHTAELERYTGPTSVEVFVSVS